MAPAVPVSVVSSCTPKHNLTDDVHIMVQATRRMWRWCDGTRCASTWRRGPPTEACGCGTWDPAVASASSSATAHRCAAACDTSCGVVFPSSPAVSVWQSTGLFGSGAVLATHGKHGTCRSLRGYASPSVYKRKRLGTPCATLPPQITALDFTPDGKALAVGSEDGVVAVWDVAGGRRLGASQQHAGPVWALAASRGEGALLASGAGCLFLLYIFDILFGFVSRDSHPSSVIHSAAWAHLGIPPVPHMSF